MSIRKDTLDRHWNNKHKDRILKGEKPEFKLPSMGSGSLLTLGVKKINDDANENLADYEAGTSLDLSESNDERVDTSKRHFDEEDDDDDKRPSRMFLPKN